MISFGIDFVEAASFTNLMLQIHLRVEAAYLGNEIQLRDTHHHEAQLRNCKLDAILVYM